MATRPVFVPDTDPGVSQLVHVHEVDFQWRSGRSPEGIKANVAKLHAAAGVRGLAPLLHIAVESDDPLGTRVSAPNLTVEDENSFLVSLPAVFQGSKVFTEGGPYVDLYRKRGDELAGDPRLTESGQHIGFRFMRLEWGLKAQTMFYDWLVLHAIHRYRKVSSDLRRFKGFIDIECPTGAHAVCHARSCALYVALAEKKMLGQVIEDQDGFINTLMRDSYYKP